MNKKNIRLMLLLMACVCICVLMIAGCAPETEEPAAEPAEPEEPAESEEPAEVPEEPKEIFRWKLQAGDSPPGDRYDVLNAWGQAVELTDRVRERTNGGLDIEPFPLMGLFNPLEAPTALKEGAVEMLHSSGAYHVAMVPASVIEAGFPYAFKDHEDLYKFVFETDLVEIMREHYAEHNNAYLANFGSTGATGYITKFPINSIEDLQGKMIRAVGQFGEIASAHGGTPVNIPGAESYVALQRGTVDGVIFPHFAGVTFNLFEVAKYQSWPPVQYVTTSWLINLDSWNSLPPEYQEILQEEIDKVSKYSHEVAAPQFDLVSQEVGAEEFGSEAIWLSDEEFFKMQEAVMPLWDKWEDHVGDERLAQIIRDIAVTE